MKSKLIALLVLLSMTSPAPAQTEQQQILSGFRIILECQASYKIAAYYVDIYQSFREGLEKTDSDLGDQLKSQLKQDWDRAESVGVIIKQTLDARGIDPAEFEEKAYNLYQLEILSEITKKAPAHQHVQGLFKRNRECSDAIDRVSETFGINPD